ncbi:hypothetical protein [Clostridium sp. BJN0001]|uniref:hypothetical protein n=1 Tax=Clostridium sp. BJN0001 TaxID=2930219 RepID=UPI001FD22BA5|nr:hypothetical protein [Clostridium sp. BJN0001]
MEKAFKLGKDSQLYKDYQKYIERVEFQKKCVCDFFKNHEIKTTKYYVTGDGFCNKAFNEYEKKDIRIGIIPNECDKKTFKKELLRPSDCGLCMFRANGKLSRSFQNYAIEKQFVINILEPYANDYFKSLGFGGYSLAKLIDENNVMYIKISSEHLGDKDVPKGLEEIKISEFYAIKERIDVKQ